MGYKKLFTHVESHASAVSLLESGEQRYIKAISNNNNNDGHRKSKYNGHMTQEKATDYRNRKKRKKRKKRDNGHVYRRKRASEDGHKESDTRWPQGK